ncbi:MAG: helix-turn-helix domain-containing protein [Gammaproteobacteria bacterium]|nr:MAG: helix-turn-helix domain-containing protein [Gammaproteobacteria bacterium]
MKTVSILGFDSALASAITGMNDLLSMAGVTWYLLRKETPRPFFNVRLLTADGSPVRCAHGLSLQAAGDFSEALDSDILVVPTITRPVNEVLSNNPALIDTLQTASERQILIAGNCTGVFFLGESGILEGRTATTHWAYAEAFRRRYPNVHLQPEQMVTEDGHILCSGGGAAWKDLGLYLTERFLGREEALNLARTFVLELNHDARQPQLSWRTRAYHQDEDVRRIQQWLQDHLSQPIRIEALADQFNMSARTLTRRFQRALGDTPLGYLQTIRLEQAKTLLVETLDPISVITHAVGYEDISSFTKLFRRRTGMTPRDYRSRFQRPRTSRSAPA